MANNDKIEKWKKLFCEWCEKAELVRECVKNPTSVKYFHPLDKSVENIYDIDFKITLSNDKDVYICVASLTQGMPPKKLPENPTLEQYKKYVDKANAYLDNIAKWDACYKYAYSVNAQFKVFTENTLKKYGII